MTEKDLEIQELRRMLKSYEDTGLTPGAIIGLCEMDKRSRMAKMLRWEEAEKDGRLVVLPAGVTVHSLQDEYTHAKHLAKEQLPSPSYTTGHIEGFYEGVVSVLEKIFTHEEAKAALKGEDNATSDL